MEHLTTVAIDISEEAGRRALINEFYYKMYIAFKL